MREKIPQKYKNIFHHNLKKINSLAAILALPLLSTSTQAQELSSKKNIQTPHGYLLQAQQTEGLQKNPFSQLQLNRQSSIPVGVPYMGIWRYGNEIDLGIANLSPGATYGIITKTNLVEDPWNNPYQLDYIFTASASEEYFTAPITEERVFFSALDLGQYTGPIIKIISPAPYTLVSNDLNIEVKITDILPLVNLEVIVNSTGISSRDQGSTTMKIPTYYFPNGTNVLYVKAINSGVPVETEDILRLKGWDVIPLVFSNALTLEKYQPLYSRQGYLELEYRVANPSTYEFTITNLDTGEGVFSTNGLSSNGKIQPVWDFSDNAGQLVSAGAYQFALEASTIGSALAVGGKKKIYTTNYLDKGVTVAKTMLVGGAWPSSSTTRDLEQSLQRLHNHIFFHSTLSPEIVGDNRDPFFYGVPMIVKPETETNDVDAIERITGFDNVGGWLLEGHGGATTLLAGQDGYLKVLLESHRVQENMRNQIGANSTNYLLYEFRYNKRLMHTMLLGCGTVDGNWPEVTGTHRAINQIANNNIEKSVFIGFDGISYVGPVKNDWMETLFYGWVNDPYEIPMIAALDLANDNYPAVKGWGVTMYGYPFLQYKKPDN